MDATLFCEALTFCDCELGSSDDVFELLERHLRAGGYVADTWLDAIRERERAYPTGLACQELGVAIPQCGPVPYHQALYRGCSSKNACCV